MGNWIAAPAGGKYLRRPAAQRPDVAWRAPAGDGQLERAAGGARPGTGARPQARRRRPPPRPVALSGPGALGADRSFRSPCAQSPTGAAGADPCASAGMRLSVQVVIEPDDEANRDRHSAVVHDVATI